jgi:hypothetical protein
VFESGSLVRELAGELVSDCGLMGLIKTPAGGESIVVVTGGELERDTVGSVEPESVVFPS